MGKIVSIIAMRPVTFFFLLTFIVLLIPSMVIPIWYNMMKKIEKHVEMEASYARYQLVTKVEDVAKLIYPINSTSINVASILSTRVTGDKLVFSEIQNKVAPALYVAKMITPQTIQASYIGLDGLFFSYLKEGDQTFAIYANTTFKLGNYTWYTQLVKPASGELLGEATITKPHIVINETWYKQAMASPKTGYASLGFRWSPNGNEGSSMFLDTASLGGAGAISLGFQVEGLTDLLSSKHLLGGASLYMTSLSDGKVLIEGLKEANVTIKDDKALVHDSNNDFVGEIQCNPSNGVANGDGTAFSVGGAKFVFYCSTIDVAMVPMVYVLACPSNGLVSHVHEHTKVALIVLIVTMGCIVIYVFAFVALIVRAARREVHLCATYMREMEKTAQAERKSMKQSLAFASATHDVRGYLACIKGLTELSSSDVAPSSEVASNLRKINTCAEDLLALVNSILDFSKIEAGKMHLEETDFNLPQLLEDIADLHHPISMKKGVDLILDPCDGSIFKFSHVRGDKGKLKQILGNLLSNAVKFTSEGNICIKCEAKNKPSFENSIINSNRNNNNLLNRVSQFFYRNLENAYNDLEVMKKTMMIQDRGCVEFEFRVEDTGPGIPKDKRRLIFENFVQVKETSAGQVGTGLGLGIVQSLVRLMGGDIEIVDKSNGESGTCFKFNIFLKIQDQILDNNNPRQLLQFTDHNKEYMLNPNSNLNSNSNLGLTTCVRSGSPKVHEKSSLVILLIKNEARRGMVYRYMDRLGLNLKVVSHWKQLSLTLKKVKSRLIEPTQWVHNSSSPSSCSDRGLCRGGSSKLLPLNMMDGSDEGVLPVYRRSNIRGGAMRCILLIIDCNAGDDFRKLQRLVSEFRKNLHMTCTTIKVVWVDRPDTRRAHFRGLGDESLPWTDQIISEPLHGSRLCRIVRLLPEFGGVLVNNNTQSETTEEDDEDGEEEDEVGGESSGGGGGGGEIKVARKKRNLKFTTCGGGSGGGGGDSYGRECEIRRVVRSSSSEKSMPRSQIAQRGEIQEAPRDSEVKKSPLQGKKILIVEDHLLQRKLAEACVRRLGAETQTCGNGKEALDVICKALSDQHSKFPYDCIIMDCQMPVMNGYEATRRIREEEKKYGIHIPIIALSANEEGGEEGKMIVESGMDFQLTKPLRAEELLKLKQNLF